MRQAFPALVISVGRNAAWVALDSENVPRAADLKRLRGKREMLVPGDRVFVHLLEDGRALVQQVEPRTLALRRHASGGRAKTMAANVDTLVTVTSLADPPPRLRTLDQLLAFTEIEAIEALLIFTKPDLAEVGEASRLAEVYGELGYRCIIVNPKSGDGVSDLRAILHGRRSLLCGVSGVGKSSIFRALGGEARVGNVSDRGLGRQTTTAARLYRFDSGFLIDSPGVGEFGLGEIGPRDLAGAFREMRLPSAGCRFSDCTHLIEPGCAVRAAVDAGRIASSRYASYRSILGL